MEQGQSGLRLGPDTTKGAKESYLISSTNLILETMRLKVNWTALAWEIVRVILAALAGGAAGAV